MSNMSYCRFENTLADLQDCLEAMQEVEDMQELDLGEYEEEAFTSMANVCRAYLKEYNRLLATIL
jgi:hypothetical protein